jgi:TRAP transporter TAXI family solute receptor
MIDWLTRAIGPLILTFGLITLLPEQGSAQSTGSPTVFRVATASKSGTFYPIGSLIAKGITTTGECTDRPECGVTGLIAVAQVSNGSVANVQAVSGQTIESGLAQADVIYWAYASKGRFAGTDPMTDLRAVANLYPGSLHIVTSAGAGIRSVVDLRGKRVALDEPGSGTLATAELILAAAGLSKAEIQPLYIKHNHAWPMLARGELDAFFFVAGYPTGSVIEVSKTTDIRLVPLSGHIIATLTAKHPYLAEGIIPAGVYPGVDRDVPTLDIGTQLIVHSSLDPDLVHAITAAMWSARTRELLDTGHPKGKQVRLETALRGVAIPLHPGAERFYRETGTLKK